MPIILIIFGIVLIIVNIKAINKKESSFKNVLKYKKEDISDLEIEIGQIRQDVAESLTELQQEILELKDIIKNQKDNVSNEELLANQELLTNQGKQKKKISKNKDNVVNDINYKNKTERINELLELGLSEDEICEKLSLGKGEVLLVKNLFKK